MPPGALPSAVMTPRALLGLALSPVGHPVWGVIALALGALVHAWPALLQVSVLGRIDELQAQIRGRQLLW